MIEQAKRALLTGFTRRMPSVAQSSLSKLQAPKTMEVREISMRRDSKELNGSVRKERLLLKAG